MSKMLAPSLLKSPIRCMRGAALLSKVATRYFQSSRSVSSSLSNHLYPLPNGSPSHFGREVIGIDLAKATSNDVFAEEVNEALYQHGVLVFRNQSHITPQDEMNFARLFSHQADDENQSYTGGAGTQHRLPEYPSIALVGSYRVENFYGLTAESKGVYNEWPHDQRAWHCDGLADTHPPPDLTTMRCLITPQQGGQTLFACSVKAAELMDVTKLETDWGIHPEDVRVNYRLFGKYEIAREGTHLLSASGSKGQTDQAWDVNLSDGTSVPLVIRERHSGKKSLVGSYHVASISSLADSASDPPRLDFEGANKYMAEVWKPGLSDEYLYRHQWRVGDLVAWSNRLVIHTATSTSAYAGEQRLHTRIRMRSRPEDAPKSWSVKK